MSLRILGLNSKTGLVGMTRCLNAGVRKAHTDSRIPGREDAVVVNKDGSMIICWHPEPNHPYELSRPIPDVPQVNTVLKSTYDDDKKDLFRKEHPYYWQKKLQELTFTTKRTWFPSREDKEIKIKEKQPKDREYL